MPEIFKSQNDVLEKRCKIFPQLILFCYHMLLRVRYSKWYVCLLLVFEYLNACSWVTVAPKLVYYLCLLLCLHDELFIQVFHGIEIGKIIELFFYNVYNNYCLKDTRLRLYLYSYQWKRTVIAMHFIPYLHWIKHHFNVRSNLYNQITLSN